MNSPPDIRAESEPDPRAESEGASNERTNERTDAADTYGCLSGTGSRRERAQETYPPISYHSESVAYYLARAREAIREASAEIHKREVPKAAEAPPPQPKPETDTEETA